MFKFSKLKKRITNVWNYLKYWEQWGEHMVCNGTDNSDLIFYVIRKKAADCGLLAYYITNLGFIRHAIENGYIPVIDMQNSMIDSLMDDDELGKVNIWEKYFLQPCGYGLEDVSRSKNVILGKDWGLFGNDITFPMYDDDLFNNVNGQREYWHDLINKYYKLSDDMDEFIKNSYQEILTPEEKVLGVLYRGTDFTSNAPKGHYISPSFEMMKEKIDEVILNYKVDKIYLATEDVRFRRYLDDIYPGKIVSVQNRYVDYKENSCINNNIPRGLTKYEAGKMYLGSIYILSKSNYLIACRCSAASVCACLNTKFDYEYYWNLGKY